jgi:hypothetical protein
MNRGGERGFSIAELLIVSFIFSMFMVACYLMLGQGIAVWGKTESSQNVGFQLQKARTALHRDLLQASRVELETSGSLLWLLSSIGPVGQQAQHDDGRPFWQRNVLYHLAKPTDHDKLFKVSCGRDPALCPHKFLIRTVLDTGAPTHPGSLVSQQEVLIEPKRAKSYAIAPKNFYPKPVLKDVETISVVATGLLYVNFEVNPTGVSPGEVEITLKGFDLTKGGTKVHLGRDDLHQSPLTEEVKFSVFLPD